MKKKIFATRTIHIPLIFRDCISCGEFLTTGPIYEAKLRDHEPVYGCPCCFQDEKAFARKMELHFSLPHPIPQPYAKTQDRDS